jgi:hypothetical protein
MIRLRTLDREITSLEFFLMVARLRADTRNPSDAAANRRTAPAAVGVEMCASDGQGAPSWPHGTDDCATCLARIPTPAPSFDRALGASLFPLGCLATDKQTSAGALPSRAGIFSRKRPHDEPQAH